MGLQFCEVDEIYVPYIEGGSFIEKRKLLLLGGEDILVFAFTLEPGNREVST